MAKAANTGKITKVSIRMYRGGTGDFFILQFKKGNTVSFKMMIDCGCIEGSKAHFLPRVQNLKDFTGGKIDLLVVTHEHADHINGFQLVKDLFKEIEIKKVWFAWTEDDGDPFANDLRKNHSELDMALKIAVSKLNSLAKNNYYEALYAAEEDGKLMMEGKKYFIDSLTALSELNISRGLAASGTPKPTMVELLKGFNVIKANTEVEFLEPGDIRSNLAGAKGIRFYVLGPPKSIQALNLVHSDDGNFEQRENPSTGFAFISALAAANSSGSTSQLPFEAEYEKPDEKETKKMKNYYDTGGDWRKIDHDWLYSAGSLGLRYERSINNTSLALAIQFEDTEKILLFPGDAELGNWESWHNGLDWSVKINGQFVKKKIDYFLNKTAFYKVGHHVSQNGTAKGKGVEMMTSPDLTVMATLDFRKIKTNWRNTMPNDLLTAELIKKAEGKFYFSGERNKIMPNVKTDRVTIKPAHEATLNNLNAPFDGEFFLECEIEA